VYGNLWQFNENIYLFYALQGLSAPSITFLDIIHFYQKKTLVFRGCHKLPLVRNLCQKTFMDIAQFKNMILAFYIAKY
jgi:hypothetical protein